MKLVAGRTGQEYNVRKNRRGAYWEDRYHATAVESNRYLRQCITYIDMNKDAHYKWAAGANRLENRGRENRWTQSIAVGSKAFIEQMKEALGFRAKGRKIICADDAFELRKVLGPYGKTNNLDSGNTFLWN